MVKKALEDKNVKMIKNAKVSEVLPDKVIFKDGSEVICDLAVWATGAEAQGVTASSDLELLNGFFRVNDTL